DLCDAAVDAAVLQSTDQPDRYTFAHALIEHTLYDGLSPARRSRAHYAVAEALEAMLGDDPGERAAELAYQWAAAVQPTDMSKAIRYAQLAGQRALDQLAPEEAVRWFGQALDMLNRSTTPDPRRRIEVLIGLGTAQRQHGVSEFRETLLEAARLADADDHVDLFVRATISNHRGWNSLSGATDHERIDAIDRALERLDHSDTPERVRLLTISASERIYSADVEDRRSRAKAAVAAARRSGDRGALAMSLTASYSAVVAPDTVSMCTEWSTEACEIGDELRDPGIRIQARMIAAACALQRGDRDALEHHSAVYQEVVEQAPFAAWRWLAIAYRVPFEIVRGEIEEAERFAEAALVYGNENGQPDALTIFGAELVNIRYHQGRYEDILPLIERALVDSPDLPVYAAVFVHGLARTGQLDRAREVLDEHLASDLAVPLNVQWVAGQVCWAEAACLTGSTAVAERVRERLVPYPDQMATTIMTVQPAIAHYLGMIDHLLGRLDDGDRWFARAAAVQERFDAPLLNAYTQASWASLLA
ncbi:MAG TPA: hypothetical protein VGI86_01035, partial [Acidimicrobiia bacterium]